MKRKLVLTRIQRMDSIADPAGGGCRKSAVKITYLIFLFGDFSFHH